MDVPLYVRSNPAEKGPGFMRAVIAPNLTDGFALPGVPTILQGAFMNPAGSGRKKGILFQVRVPLIPGQNLYFHIVEKEFISMEGAAGIWRTKERSC